MNSSTTRGALASCIGTLLLVGCSGGGGGGPGNTPSPSGLTYATNPAVYTKGFAITPNTPTSLAGPVVSYSVSPKLPEGLSLHTTTGLISGTATAITAQATYTVTATNSGGATSVGLVITVNDVAAQDLTYATNPAMYAKGFAITPNTPTSLGGPVVSFSVSPKLPEGLSLHTTTA